MDGLTHWIREIIILAYEDCPTEEASIVMVLHETLGMDVLWAPHKKYAHGQSSSRGCRMEDSQCVHKQLNSSKKVTYISIYMQIYIFYFLITPTA